VAKFNRNIYWILVLAAVIRFTGIWHGLPALYNSDEPFVVNNALSYGAKKSLEPSYFDYPTLYSYVLFGVYGGYYLVGSVSGAFDDAIDFAAGYFLDPTGFYLIARILSVLWGVLAVYVVYRAGRRFLSERTGLYAALTLALSWLHVEKSHWGLLESPLVLLSALALYFILKLSESANTKNTILAGLISGLAVSTKYNAGFIFVPLFVACFFAWRKQPRKLLQHWLLAGVSMVAGFLIASPYWLITPESFIQVFQWSYFQAQYGVAGHASSMPLLWPFFEMMFVDWTVGVLMILGFVYAFFQRQRAQVILVSFVTATLLFVGFWERGDLHYIMPVYPALVLLAGLFLHDIAGYVKSRSVWTVVLVLIFGASLTKIVLFDVRLTQPDTRTLAQRWIERNIPDGALIGYENYAYGPNLFDPARFLKYDREKQVLPFELKERLLQARHLRKHYNLVNFRKDFKAPGLSRTARRDSTTDRFEQRKAYLRSLLPGVTSMQKNGLQYVVISSYNYRRYFSRKPPERAHPSWYSFEVSRRFYQGVFESDQLELLKAFKPTFWNTGPVIRFYRIKEMPGRDNSQ